MDVPDHGTTTAATSWMRAFDRRIACPHSVSTLPPVFEAVADRHWAVSTLLQTCCELHAQRAPAQVMGATTGNATRQSATLVPQIAAMLFTLAHHPALERLERRFGTLQDMRCVLGREI
jgi:hypothetical protein